MTLKLFYIKNFIFLFFLFFTSKNIFSLNTSNAKGSNTVYALSAIEYYNINSEVWGWVNYNAGFYILPNTTLKLGIVPHVKGGNVILDNIATIELLADLHLSSSSSNDISINGVANLKGNKGALFLHGDAILPASSSLYILNDTIIDGQSNSVFLDSGFQFIVDSSATLTLRNLCLKNLHGQASTSGGIVLTDETSSLALQNVKVDINGSYTFDVGSLFIHEDVLFTGSVHGDVICTDSIPRYFVHSSDDALQAYLRICDDSTLYFDSGINFVYDHQSSIGNECRQQLIMTDTSSTLYLNGSTLSVPAYSNYSGLELWLGKLILENRVTFSNYSAVNGWPNTQEAKGITFGRPPEDLNVFALSGCRIDIHGSLNYYNYY
ncbi:MAG: hypothetical protein ABIA74_03005 [bacterium]